MASSLTFILVPGHWHTTTHLQPLLNTLHQQGHTAKAVQLASVGLKSPRPTFADDVGVIYDAVSQELHAGKEVCLVLHSYAGMPGAEAVNRLIAAGLLPSSEEGNEEKGRLRRVIFIAAYTFPAGMELDAKKLLGPENPGLSIDENDMNHIDNPAHYFFNDLSPEAAQPWVDALGATYYMNPCPVISSEDWRKAPVTALLCKQDNAVPPERQTLIWQGTDSEWIDAAHTPYVSQPAKVAEIVVRLAGGS